jgi:N utilization substance protein A
MSELIAALNQLEKEKGIDKDVIMEAIENSLLAACKRDFGSADNVVVNMDRETGDIYVYAIKEVVDEVYDPALEISLGKAKAIDQNLNLGDTVRIEITPKDFGRIAAMHARSVIVQKIKEEKIKENTSNSEIAFFLVLNIKNTPLIIFICERVV